MTGFVFQISEVRHVVVRQGASGVPAFSGFAALAVIKIKRHIFAGVPIQTTVFGIATSIDKNLMFVHASLEYILARQQATKIVQVL